MPKAENDSSGITGSRPIPENFPPAEGIWITDADDTMVYFNPGMETIAGVTSDDVLGLRVTRDFPPETTVEFLPFYMKARETLQPVHYEANVITPTGRPTIQAGWLVPRERDGRFDGMVCTIRDVTEMRRMERYLRESEERFRTMARLAPVGIYTTDADGNCTFVNEAWCAMAGLAPEEAMGAGWAKGLHPDDRKMVSDGWYRLTRDGGQWSGEYRFADRAGNIRWVLGHAAPLRDDKGNTQGYIGTNVDITGTHNAEARLRQAQKMEAIGRLAAGIAHDFNNILTGIGGFSSLVLKSVDSSSQVHEDVREISALAERAAKLTHQLLAFSRQQPMQAERIDLNELVSRMQGLLKRLVGETIRISFKPDDSLWHTNADASQVEQIVMDLVVNAREAMPEGGSLTLETRNVTLDIPDALPLEETHPGDYVVLTIADTGVGMSDEIRARVFEPFFTTRGFGRSAGLGLSMCYGIAKQHGGHISVESTPGEGSAFHLYLPRMVKQPRRAAALLARKHLSGSETVLVVEDEESVLDVTRRGLESYGYTVLSARSAREARAFFGATGETVDIVLSDVVMPECDGRELVADLRARKPGLKVVYMSGYTDEQVVPAEELARNVEFLSKPFSPEALASSIRRTLDA